MPLDELYFAVADVVERVKTKKKSLRSAVYEHQFQDKKKLLRLSCETVKYAQLFDGLLENSNLSTRLLDERAYEGSLPLIHVLLYEFLIGNGLNQATQRLKRPIHSLNMEIRQQEKALSAQGRGLEQLRNGFEEEKEKEIEIPRYARINGLKWTRDEAIETLREEKWQIIDGSDTIPFSQQITQLRDDQVLFDPHIPELLIFANSANLHAYWMIEQRYLIFQDKASCLPAFLISPPSGSHCVDTCAAPGNKTSHLAAYVGNEGCVWAFDRDPTRANTMKRLVKQSGAGDIVSVECGDFLRIDPSEERWKTVEFAVVDPPCSGSGMVKRMDEWTGSSAQADRLGKLANLQAMLLKHALKLPSLKRLAYSTCSIHEEENEQVVREVLKECSTDWRLAENLLPMWALRGKESYEFGKHCLRADPKITFTNGFFVVVFERIEEKKKKKKAKKRKIDDEC
ncbi:unnamed protein product, partial [Mesorhabditis belari]|uniref:SAM-dependent MTase RsmB/NOP-type domain-containing protein n=1 Tax=Mesorhabditis belari TaxID=2138241 RepID=A0AAF3FKG0_9BILA